MQLKNEILNELKTISETVASVPFTNVFSVDERYFSGIEAELKARMAAATQYATHHNFAVPDNYFETLTDNILVKIKDQENEVFSETESYSPLIAGIGNKNVYTAPTNYFENIYFKNKASAAKVISMRPAKSMFRYAAAAVITGLLGLTIFNVVSKPATIPVNEYALQTASVINSANNIIQTGTFDEELASISDKDIVQYLQLNGQDVNAALVASSTDDTDKLPEAVDYLLDENVLDNYLNEHNLKN